MRRILTFPLLLMTGALLCPEQTEGGGCAVGHYATATYSVPYVAPTATYAPAVYLAVFQVYQPVPVVFSTYQPVVAVPAVVPNAVAPVAQARVTTAAQAGATPCEQQLQALTVRIAQLEAALKVPAPTRPSQQKEDAPPPQTQAPAGKGLSVMVTACAGCHERQNAAEKGKGLVLLDGDALVDLSDAQLVKVYRNVLSGKMPPKTKLTQEEGSSLLEFLDTLKGGAK